MLSGIKEIAVIVIVLLALFLVPRMIRPKKNTDTGSAEKEGASRKNDGLTRLAVLISALWVTVAFLLWNPFTDGLSVFAVAGILPVAFGWGCRWVWLGFKK
ncbi:hypothetical protein [Pontiella agarivorans]|uniref:Uncharacterized protein n=1 Tax=Pontiella agarivorans TaxID=3038953 RepID=A0ABU5MU10_9BACT|nr:hypothetical protein [Pontiella agarivorans]MDZ8117695.1 hypothetical protein [Pontiella agarivorans]